jgi:hypothetical protein
MDPWGIVSPLLCMIQSIEIQQEDFNPCCSRMQKMDYKEMESFLSPLPRERERERVPRGGGQ